MSFPHQDCKCQNHNCERGCFMINDSNSNDYEVFYDATDETLPRPSRSSSKLQQSNSITALLQKLGDPQHFKRALQNIIDTAENLKTIFEVVIERSLEKCRNSVGTFTVPKVPYLISSVLNEQVHIHDVFSKCECCGNQRNLLDVLNVNVEPVVVTVPLTLYIKPLVNEELEVPDTYIPPNVSEDLLRGEEIIYPSVNVEGCCREDLDEPMDQNLTESCLNDSVEPIRTASISVSDGRSSYSPFGLPKFMRFSEDQESEMRQSIPQSSITSTSEAIGLTILEPERDSMEPKALDPSNEEEIAVAEKEHSIDGSGATQNDRHRDHSNLKHQPNNEAPAGLERQLAGHRQNQQAKDENNEDTNSKNRASWDKYFTPIGSRLGSNDRENGNGMVPSVELNLKMPLANKCMEPKGSYECVCGVEDGSCHKFWCQRRETANLNEESFELSPRDFKISFNARKVFTDGQNDGQVEEVLGKVTADTSYDEKMEDTCNCDSKGSKFEDKSLEGLEIRGSRPRITNQFPPSGNIFESQSSMDQEQLFDLQYPDPSLSKNDKLPDPPMDNVSSRICKSDFGDESHQLSGTPNPTMDPNVIPLLQSIFDVLQNIREDQLSLRSLAIKNLKTQPDESFGDLPAPPLPFNQKKLRTFSAPSFKVYVPSRNNSASSLEIDRNLQEIVEDSNLSFDVIEPPERDVEDMQNRNQRLIPVDMDLLRAEDDLAWEPQPNIGSSEREDNQIETQSVEGRNTSLGTTFDTDSIEKCISVQPHFLHFPEELPSQEEFKAYPDILVEAETEGVIGAAQILILNKKSDLQTQKSGPDGESNINKEDCDCTCDDPKSCLETCCRKSLEKMSDSKMDSMNEDTKLPSLSEIKEISLKDEFGQTSDYLGTSPEIQVNMASLQNMTSRSDQFIKFDDSAEGFSEEKLIKKSSSINKSNHEDFPLTKINVGTDNPAFGNEHQTSIGSHHSNCHCHQARAKQQNPDMNNFIQSLLCDLKAMKSFRENSIKCNNFGRLSYQGAGCQRPSKTLSYPATIESVQELGTNSLFVKWKVQNKAFIGGYEIFLDDRLTNRYFSCVHQAAVICNVNLKSPHKITLRAQPLLPTKPPQLTANSNFLTCHPTEKYSKQPEAGCLQPDGSVWYPSVYHFEPNFYSAPTNAVLY